MSHGFSKKTLFGLKPGVLHFNNTLLHGVNTALVFVISRQIIPAMWKQAKGVELMAAFAAVIWAVHPMKVESVAWAVERKDVLFGLFYLLAVIQYLKFLKTEKGVKHVLLATLFYLLACLSKSMAITFIGAAFLLDLLFKGLPAMKGRLLLSKIPLAVVFVFALHTFGFLFAPEGGHEVVNAARKSVGVPERVRELPPAVQHVAISNFRLLFFAAHNLVPAHRSAVYPRAYFLRNVSGWLLPLLVIPLILLGLLWWRPPWRRTMGFGLAWFFVTVIPVLISDGVGTNFLSDRYTYIPSLGLVWWLIPAICVYGAGKKVGKFTLGHAICAALVIALVIMTSVQIRVWRSSMDLWNQAIRNYPQNWYANYNRGKLLAKKDLQQALIDLGNSIEEQDARGEAYYARGTIFMENDRIDEAIADFTMAAQYFKDEERIESLINRGSCYRRQKQYQNALNDFSEVLAMQKRNRKALNNRGLTYSDMGRYQLALQDFNTALDRPRSYAPALVNRGNVYLKPEVRQYANAEADFRKVTELTPDDHNAWFRLGYALAQRGRHNEAIESLSKAIQLMPSQGFYNFGRAQSYEALGNRQAALQDYQQAQSLGVQVDPAVIARNQ